jgi:predicted nuclease of predicted toxin-antitoxin system
MIIADENLERYWIELLRKKQYSVLSIAESHPQITDSEVAELARKHQGILITEDKDFGELIFAYGIPKLTIIFLRYDQPGYSQIENSVLETVEKYLNIETPYFITITKTKIRVREI